MGAKHSGHEENKEESTFENKGVVANESGGFHVLEIHAPTVGMGLIFVIVVALAAVTFIACYRRFKRRVSRAAHHNRGANHFNYAARGRCFGDTYDARWPSEERRSFAPYYTSRIRALDEEAELQHPRFMDDGLDDQFIREGLARQHRRPLPAPRRTREAAREEEREDDTEL